MIIQNWRKYLNVISNCHNLLKINRNKRVRKSKLLPVWSQMERYRKLHVKLIRGISRLLLLISEEVCL